MGYNKENYRRVKQEYEMKNYKAKEAASKRQAELQHKFPELAQFDDALAQTGLKIMRETAHGKEGLDTRINQLRMENQSLQADRAAFLQYHGYPPNYTAVQYECDLCQDTGFVGTKICTCMKKALIYAGYESCGIGKLLQTQTFETFKLGYYAGIPKEYESMKMILERSKKFANNFSEKTQTNMLFFGSTGLGKTHLSTSIAKVVIENGYDVVYESAQNIFSQFEQEKFHSGYTNGEQENKSQCYFDCDLLIIDDLGTEMVTQFVIACLYNLLNTRLNQGKRMVVNTNLTQSELIRRYSERIASRLYGEFTLFHFVGKDIRMERLNR